MSLEQNTDDSFSPDSENGIKDSKAEVLDKFSKEQHLNVPNNEHVASTSPQEIQSTEAHDTLKLCPHDQFYKLKTGKAKETYPVIEKECRTCLAFIICSKKFDYLFDRDDAEVNILNMQELFQNVEYSVVVKENFTAQEMESELMHFAGYLEHQSSENTFLVFMSHGILEGICGVKDRNKKPDILHDDTIFTVFNNSNNSSLRNQLKVLSMQACRGRKKKHDGSVCMSSKHNGIVGGGACKWNRSIAKAHVEKDFIAFKSTTPHNISWKVGKSGSLFISKLIDCFKKDIHDIASFNFLAKNVQNSFEVPGELTQMPSIERVSMTRYFYLFPGYKHSVDLSKENDVGKQLELNLENIHPGFVMGKINKRDIDKEQKYLQRYLLTLGGNSNKNLRIPKCI
ncbi:caspase-12 isoform X1 [Sigmodon hispidus]